jgi:hypothetical protein
MNARTSIFLSLLVACTAAASFNVNGQTLKWDPPSSSPAKDSTYLADYVRSVDTLEGFRNVWSLDLLISNGGFGMGTIYRRAFTNDVAGFVSFSISESKDDREFEYVDPYYYQTIVPGKLNRFLVLPLLVGVQYRLFRDDIVDTFRPFVNAGVGPTMIYQMPFVELVPLTGGGIQPRAVEFFNSIGKGHPEYTASAFIGFGANFGGNKSNVFGVNFRYYFTYLFGDGLPSMFDIYTGETRARKTEFGGFFITLNVGMAY